MKMHFIIVGHGPLSNEIRTQVKHRGFTQSNLEEPNDIWRAIHSEGVRAVVIHTGNGSQLVQAINLCENHNLILINGSRNLTVQMPTVARCVIVNSSTFALGVLEYIQALIVTKQNLGFAGMVPLEIIESRSEDDKWGSNVSLAVAKAVGLSSGSINLVTNPWKQREMGVPETKLAEHFWISVVFRGTGGNCKFTLEIPDHATYANGAIDIAQFALSCRESLDAGFYDTQRILELSGELVKDATKVIQFT